MVVDIYNLDGGKHLLNFSYLPESCNLIEEVEQRLGIPKENQAYYVNLKKWTPSNSQLISEKIHLGLKPTTKMDGENKLIRNINGSYGKVHIKGKKELLEVFDSKPWSTYFNLKVYIEIKLNIPVKFQVILRHTKGCYCETKDEEYLMNYVFDDYELRYQNAIYVCIEQSTQYTPDDNDIAIFKPISIYTQHGPNDKTKILAFSPGEHICTISEIKSRIEKQLGLPASYQNIYTENAVTIDTDLQDSIFKIYDSAENEVVFYLTCDCIENERSSRICKQYGIKMVEVQIRTPSGNIIAECPIKMDTNFGSFKSMVEEKHKLPKTKLIFYDTNFNVLFDWQDVWDHFGWQRINRTCTIYMLTEKLDCKDAKQICEQLEVPQVSTEIVVSSLSGSEELHKVNMKQLEYKDRAWFHCLAEDIEDKLKIPTKDFLLYLNGEVLDINHVATRRKDWKDLYLLNGAVQEEIIFNITFKPTMNAQVEEYCQNHNILMLKTVRLKSLTSEMDIDIRKEPMESISEVKDFIANEKKIPICAIDLFFNGKTLNDHQNLMGLFIKENNTTTSLDFHVVVRALKDIVVHLHSPYTKRLTLTLPVHHIFVSGSKTFYNLKEDIASVTGIPVSQLHIICPNNLDVSNESFIKDLVQDQISDEMDVTIWKTVTVRKINIYGSTKTEKHDIANDDETIHKLLWRINFDKRLKFQNKRNMSSGTLLHALGSDDVIELKEEEDRGRSPCKMM